MASGRILKHQISVSEQVNDLSIHSALLFTWMITHADDFGRMYGSARKIKALVVPMRDDLTIKKVEECLNEIVKANLIQRYEIEGNFYIQFPSWEEHQSGLHKRTKSRFPELNEEYFQEIPGNSGLTEQNRTEQEENICSEKNNSEQVKIFIELPVNEKNRTHQVTELDLSRYQELYPAVDIPQELRNVLGWLNGNVAKRKTANGMERFLNSWFARQQNKGGTVGFVPQQSSGQSNGLPAGYKVVGGRT